MLGAKCARPRVAEPFADRGEVPSNRVGSFHRNDLTRYAVVKNLAAKKPAKIRPGSGWSFPAAPILALPSRHGQWQAVGWRRKRTGGERRECAGRISG